MNRVGITEAVKLGSKPEKPEEFEASHRSKMRWLESKWSKRIEKKVSTIPEKMNPKTK